LPSRPIVLDYLPILHRYQIVTSETLARAASSRRRALDIVDDAARMAALEFATPAASGAAVANVE
jgi:hypothetical protein